MRHVTDIDAQREKEYLDCQEKLVKRLELLYVKSLENVGASHKNACDIQQGTFFIYSYKVSCLCFKYFSGFHIFTNKIFL